MPTTDPKYSKLPRPASNFEGRKASSQPSIVERALAKLWRLAGSDDVDYAVIARNAHRMIREDGTASTAEEIIISAQQTTALLTALGITTYADLAAANAAQPIGTIFYNTATTTLAITTA